VQLLRYNIGAGTLLVQFRVCGAAVLQPLSSRLPSHNCNGIRATVLNMQDAIRYFGALHPLYRSWMESMLLSIFLVFGLKDLTPLPCQLSLQSLSLDNNSVITCTSKTVIFSQVSAVFLTTFPPSSPFFVPTISPRVIAKLSPFLQPSL